MTREEPRQGELEETCNNTVLALDVATSSGWAVAVRSRDERAASVYASGEIDLGRASRRRDRSAARAAQCAALYRAVSSLLDHYGPGLVVLEAAHFGPSVSTLATLSMLQGAALAAVGSREPPPAVLLVPSRRWQSWASSAIGWQKRRGAGGDAADARAIALWAAHQPR